MTQAGEPGDEVFVAQACAGSRAAFEALVRRYQKPVYFLVRRYVRDHDEAADLAQRTFIRAFGKLADLRGAEVFRTWLFRIAVNLSLNYLRDNARFVDDDEACEQVPVPAVGADRIQARQEVEALRQAARELPGKQRLTLELRIYEELSFRDIALALGISEGAAKVNFHYAVGKLRALLGTGENAGGAGKS